MCFKTRDFSFTDGKVNGTCCYKSLPIPTLIKSVYKSRQVGTTHVKSVLSHSFWHPSKHHAQNSFLWFRLPLRHFSKRFQIETENLVIPSVRWQVHQQYSDVNKNIGKVYRNEHASEVFFLDRKKNKRKKNKILCAYDFNLFSFPVNLPLCSPPLCVEVFRTFYDSNL